MLGACTKPGQALKDYLTEHHYCAAGETEAQKREGHVELW